MPDIAHFLNRHRTPHWPVVLVLSCGLGMVVVAGTVVGLYKTDLHLTSRVQDAAHIGGPQLDAHVDGRDAYLTGRGTESDLAHALALTAGIPGLRNVHTEVRIVAARTELDVDPAAGDPSVTVVLDHGRITLRGLVADDGSRAAIVAAAQAAVGTDGVRDRIQETRAVRAVEWTAEVAAAIAAVGDFTNVTLAFGSDRLLVTGAVATPEVKASVASALEAVGIDAAVDGLSVTEPQEPWLIIERSASVITMSGLIGRDQLQPILAAFDETYGPVPVAREKLMLAGNSADVEWPSRLAALIPSTHTLDPWSMQAEDGRVALFGVTPDPTAPERIAVVATRWGEAPPVVDVRLTPSAVVARLETDVRGTDWFDDTGTDLTATATSVLDQVALLLFEYPDIAIDVVGRPARAEDIAVDREKGLLRAAGVRSYLVGRGIDPGRIRAVGDPEPVDGEAPSPAITFVLAGGRSER